MCRKPKLEHFVGSQFEVFFVVLIVAFILLVSFNSCIMNQKGKLTVPRPMKFFRSTLNLLGKLTSRHCYIVQYRDSAMTFSEDFVLKRDNPPRQVESVCPRCSLNANCYANSCEYDQFQNKSIFFLTLKLLQQIIGILTNAHHSQNMIISYSIANLHVTMIPYSFWGTQG